MSLKDTATGYGWISIVLHWVTAAVIVYMLFLGSSVAGLEGDARAQMLLRHTSVGITAYVLLIARIVWRFYYGHPGPTGEQRGWAFTLGKWTHLIMLAAVAVMLVSGPVMYWAYGNDIVVFDWFVIPSPIGPSFALAEFMRSIHGTSALVIFIAVLMHIGGVYKHTAFNQDGTLAKILIADRQSGRRAAVEPAMTGGESDAES